MMAIRHHALAFVAASLLMPHAASAQETAETALRAWIASIDAAPGWAAGFRGLTYDQATDTATVSGLAVQTETGDVSIAFETVAVGGFAAASDGGFSARTVAADGGAIKVGFANVAVSDVELTGLGVPGLPTFAIDPARPFSTMMRLYADLALARLETGRVGLVQVIEQFDKVTSRVAYEHLRIDGLGDGKIATVRSGPLRLEAPAPQGLVKMTIGAMEAHDTDLAAFVRVYNPDAYAGGVGDMVWHSVIGLTTYSAIEMEVPGAKVAIGGVTIENFRMRQPRRSFAPFLDAVMARPDMPDEEAAALAKAHALDLLSVFGVGSFAIDRFEIAAQGIDHFSLDSFHLDDFSSDGIGTFSLDGLDAAVPDQGSFKLGRFAFGGVVFPSMDAIQAAIDGAETGVTIDPKTLAGKLGFVELAGIDVEGIGKDPMVLDKLRMDFRDYVGFIPTRIAAELAGLIVPTSVIDNPEGRKIFERLGYETLDMSYGLDMHWDPATETVAVDDLSVGVKGVGSFAARLALAGLPRFAIENPERLQEVIPALALAGGTFTFTDESIVGKSIDMLAETMKAPPDKFRQQFADAMPFLLSVSALNDPKFLAIVQKSGLLKQLQPAVKEFVGTPGSSITVTVAPPRPVPLTEINRITNDAPDTLVSVLGLSISGKAGSSQPAPAPAPAPTPAPLKGSSPSNDDNSSNQMRKTMQPQ